MVVSLSSAFVVLAQIAAVGTVAEPRPPPSVSTFMELDLILVQRLITTAGALLYIFWTSSCFGEMFSVISVMSLVDVAQVLVP